MKSALQIKICLLFSFFFKSICSLNQLIRSKMETKRLK